MKKFRGKGRRNFDPSADGRYPTTVCNIMARKDADRKDGGPRYVLRQKLGEHRGSGPGTAEVGYYVAQE